MMRRLVLQLSLVLCSLVVGDAVVEAGGASPSPPALSAARTTIITYPGPAGISPSPRYSVLISQSGSARSAFVYEVNNIGLAPYNWQGHGWNIRSELTTAWTSFDFDDPGSTAPGAAPVTIQVSMAVPSPAWTQPAVRVLPSAAGVVPSSVTRVGDTYRTTFTIRKATQYSVEFYDAASAPDFATWVPSYPLLIFADPIERDAPRSNDKRVLVLHAGEPIPRAGSWGERDGVPIDTLYFSPGVYDLSLVPSSVNTGIYLLHSHQHIYMAGGAYVKGAFVTCPNSSAAAPCSDAVDVGIRGRGVLSGEVFKRDYTVNLTNSNAIANDAPMLIDFEGSYVADGARVGQQGALVEGITLIQAPYYNITMSGINNRVDRVKLISWYPSTDGVTVGYDYNIKGIEQPGGGIIENSFFKDGDDSVKLYSSNLRVRNVVVWQSNNAGVFELSANMVFNVDDVRVRDSDVIHTEWNWPNMSNAVFAGHQGGRGLLGQDVGYHFDDIRIENSGWQLMKIGVGPSIWEFGNTELGSVSHLYFHDIIAADPQTLPSEFQSYDRQHLVSGVTFSNVRVAGAVQLDPVITFDANRMYSLSGNTMSSPLWADRAAAIEPNVQAWQMIQGTPASSPIASVLWLDQPLLDESTWQVPGLGDFFGDGFASPLLLDSASNALSIWREPLNPAQASEPSALAVPYEIPAGYRFAGVGDFDGSGVTGVLLWNCAIQNGLVLTVNAAGTFAPFATIEPGHTSTWTVAGVGDFDKHGYSDVLLRDASGNLEVIYFGAAGALATLDITVKELAYTATSAYSQANPGKPLSGHFDAGWQVAGVGTFLNGYAGIIWTNPATGDVGLSQFSPVMPQRPISAALIATLPAGASIQGFGDYNGDGAIDILYRDTQTGEIGIWYLGWMGGAYYEPAPSISESLGVPWQLISARTP
jgi:hypothetical protein